MIPTRTFELSFGWGFGFYVRYDHFASRYYTLSLYFPFMAMVWNWETA